MGRVKQGSTSRCIGSEGTAGTGGEMPCPVCRTPIAVDPVALLAGARAVCGGCGTAMRLEPGEGVRQTVEQFEAARREVRQVIGGRKRRG